MYLPPFGEKLREARKARGLTQAALGDLCGLQASAISHFETGVRKPDFDNLCSIAKALDVSLDYLMGLTNHANRAGELSETAHLLQGALLTLQELRHKASLCERSILSYIEFAGREVLRSDDTSSCSYAEPRESEGENV